jgi:hypothetical protein
MSKGKQANSPTGRIRAMLPTTYEAAYAALSDVPRNTVFCCIRALLGFKTVVKLADGTLVASVPEPKEKVRRLHRVTDAPCGREEHVEPVKSPLWAESPSQSPQATCPARGMVGLSTCLDDYTAAASGHRLGPIECGKCSVGRVRREQLARSME